MRREAFVDASYILIHFILLKLVRKEIKHDFQLFPSMSYFCFIKAELLFWCCPDHSIEPGNLILSFASLTYLPSLAKYLLAQYSSNYLSIHPSLNPGSHSFICLLIQSVIVHHSTLTSLWVIIFILYWNIL